MLRREKQWYFFEKPTQDQLGSNSGRMHDWRGSQALYLYRSATSPYLNNINIYIYRGIISEYHVNDGGRVKIETSVSMLFLHWVATRCELHYTAAWSYWQKKTIITPHNVHNRLDIWLQCWYNAFYVGPVLQQQCCANVTFYPWNAVFAHNLCATLILQNAIFCARNLISLSCPTNTRCYTDVGSMLGHRLRRWTNIKPTQIRHVVFARDAMRKAFHILLHIPVNTKHKTDVGSMLAHRLRRWSNLNP